MSSKHVVRTDAEGEYIQYDGRKFRIDWHDKLHSPAPGAHVSVERGASWARSPTYVLLYSVHLRTMIGSASGPDPLLDYYKRQPQEGHDEEQ